MHKFKFPLAVALVSLLTTAGLALAVVTNFQDTPNFANATPYQIGGTDVTTTAAELNYLDITTLGTGAASKAVVLDAGDDYTWPATGVLTYGVLKDGPAAVTITATGTELNYTDVTTLGTQQASKAVTADASNITTFAGTVKFGSSGTEISDSYAAVLTTNFQGIAAATCKDSAAITATGAAASDPCFVGPDATNGALNVLFTCYVSASNAVKIKVCNQTGSDITSFASGSYNVRVMDP